jgi:hypothetical protein
MLVNVCRSARFWLTFTAHRRFVGDGQAAENRLIVWPTLRRQTPPYFELAADLRFGVHRDEDLSIWIRIVSSQ